MHLNTFKILLFTFLIFLSCYISHCRGKAVNDLEERNQTTNSSSEFNSTVKEQSITAASQDPCEPNPCENGGSCIFNSDFSENFACECREEYIGDKCEIDQCNMFEQCQDDQVCVFKDGVPVCKNMDDEVSISSAVVLITRSPMVGLPLQVDCEARGPPGTNVTWMFENAQLITDERKQILSNHTLFITKANISDSGTYKCIVQYLNSMIIDSVNVKVKHPCEPNPCKNNGSCTFDIDFPGNFTCECKDGYTGDKCEIVSVESCHIGDCKTCEDIIECAVDCNCCPSYGQLPTYPGYCEKCNCGKQFNCTFYTHKPNYKVCHCDETGYINVGIDGKCIKDPCLVNPCQNDGECIVSGEKATCKCPRGYTGDFCEKKKCKHFRCKIAGKCTVISGQAICDCAVRYGGNFCGTDECTLMKAQCHNGRNCFPKKVPCYCSESNFGEFCSIPIEYVNYLCDSNCIETGGYCAIVNNQTAKCMCPERNEYKLDSGCTSLKNKCPMYCEQSGGYCVKDGNNEVKCKCPSGTKFIGMIGCQEGACRVNICKNGGTCIYYGLQLKPVCLCRDPFAGDFCEKRIDSLKNNTVIYSVVCVLLIVLGYGVFCLLCHRIRSMRK